MATFATFHAAPQLVHDMKFPFHKETSTGLFALMNDCSDRDLHPRPPCRMSSMCSSDCPVVDAKPKPPDRSSSREEPPAPMIRRRRSSSDLMMHNRPRAPLRLRRRNSANSLMLLPRSCAPKSDSNDDKKKTRRPRRRSSKKEKKRDKKTAADNKKKQERRDVAPVIPQLRRHRSAGDLRALMQDTSTKSKVGCTTDSLYLYNSKRDPSPSRPTMRRHRSANDLRSLMDNKINKRPPSPRRTLRKVATIETSTPKRTMVDTLTPKRTRSILKTSNSKKDEGTEGSDMPELVNYQSDYTAECPSEPESPTVPNHRTLSFTLSRRRSSKEETKVLAVKPLVPKEDEPVTKSRHSFSGLTTSMPVENEPKSRHSFSGLASSSFMTQSTSASSAMSAMSDCSDSSASLASEDIRGLMEYSSRRSESLRGSKCSWSMNELLAGRRSAPMNGVQEMPDEDDDIRSQDNNDGIQTQPDARLELSVSKRSSVATTSTAASSTVFDTNMIGITCVGTGSSTHQSARMPPAVAGEKPWACGICAEENDPDYFFCGMCADPKLWTCTVCQFGRNKSRLPHCGGCGTRRQREMPSY